tara:strand:- start:233 stop:436 length:204 start_codon:yes stop_codon:yes gene_type:complete
MVNVNVQELLRSLPYEQRVEIAKIIYEDLPASCIEEELNVKRRDFINYEKSGRVCVVSRTEVQGKYL